ECRRIRRVRMDHSAYVGPGSIDCHMDRRIHRRLEAWMDRTALQIYEHDCVRRHRVVVNARWSDQGLCGSRLPRADVSRSASDQAGGDHLARKSNQLLAQLALRRHAQLLCSMWLATSHSCVDFGSYVSRATDRLTTSRACSRVETRPRAIACTRMFPIAVASMGPATTGRPHASAVI